MQQNALIPETRTPAFKVMLRGEELNQLPEDLFIPPEALEVLLDSFSGPLDLLLYLIRKQNIDILDIPITSITQQYLHYIYLMQCRNLELAADYLLMAALLAEIKARLLLPNPVSEEADREEDEDPRMLLVRRLQAYEQIKKAAESLDALPRQERDVFFVQIGTAPTEGRSFPEVRLIELVEALQALEKKTEQSQPHAISRELMSVREKMSFILLKLQEQELVAFTALLKQEEGPSGLIVSFLALLELSKQALLIITQVKAFAPIYLQAN